MTELKSCPFCGSKARLMAQHFTDDSHIYSVGCRRCGMEGPHMHDSGPAIVAWNGLIEERTCKRFWTGAEMLCSRCANQLNDATANYCPNCGAKVVDA